MAAPLVVRRTELQDQGPLGRHGLSAPQGPPVSDTLVLSAAYEPMDQVDWRRAMTLWAAGRVDVLQSHPTRHVRSVSRAWAMPSVIRFRRGLRRYARAIRLSRPHVYLRDGGRCQYCGAGMTLSESTYDHVIPRSRGGETTWDNVVIACRPCNQRKADRTPAEAGLPLRARPVEPRSLPGASGGRMRWYEGMPVAWQPYLGAGGW